ncbi:alpha/beta hydrolase [Nonomuraea sp. NBC_01738]|uniref:alpha/beta fold hydrolase n=1 Tax=Nonomuraea sp. NBC_01738 TaxID=2976003 RepID=UPI002E11FB6F|nr:alpha/beta hydrolase [Nonomuraea sp. NBC_01738]
MRRVLSAVTLSVLAASGCGTTAKQTATPASASPGAASAAVAPIAWGACTDLVRPDGAPPAKPDPGTTCGKLKVPLDYAKPDGETIDLALIKIAATDQAKRIGSLVFNFGGPGGSGVDTLAQAAKSFTTLGARYDLVSFDPRGVERSSGVRCGGSAEMDAFTSLDTLPNDAATRAAGQAANRRFAELCQRDSGKVLPYIGTVNAARDMDRIRDAVGDAKLNYFGMSYGTQLGAVYATQFPKNVGRMVLDAPLDPTVSFEQRTIAQTRGFQQAYESFLKACVQEGCELGANAKAASRAVGKLMVTLTAQPLKVGTRELTQGLAVTSVAAALYSELSWPFLEAALGQAIAGEGDAMLYLADSYNGRNADGTYSTQMTSFPAITCVDSAERPDQATLDRTEAAALKISPLFGSAGAGSLCTVWPVPGSDEAKHVDATGSGPIVVVGGRGDPATPYQWAPKLTEQLKTATLVTYEGEGHGAYLSGSKCVKGLVDLYLLQGTVPKEGATCSA